MSQIKDTYPAPIDGWVCFHCGVRFINTNEARDHFGFDPKSTPACKLTPKYISKELRRFRCIETDLRAIVDKLADLYTILKEQEELDSLTTFCKQAISVISE